jgi:hypothetical protein
MIQSYSFLAFQCKKSNKIGTCQQDECNSIKGITWEKDSPLTAYLVGNTNLFKLEWSNITLMKSLGQKTDFR